METSISDCISVEVQDSQIGGWWHFTLDQSTVLSDVVFINVLLRIDGRMSKWKLSVLANSWIE